jgi:hypothetical protein
MVQLLLQQLLDKEPRKKFNEKQREPLNWQ